MLTIIRKTARKTPNGYRFVILQDVDEKVFFADDDSDSGRHRDLYEQYRGEVGHPVYCVGGGQIKFFGEYAVVSGDGGEFGVEPDRDQTIASLACRYSDELKIFRG